MGRSLTSRRMSRAKDSYSVTPALRMRGGLVVNPIIKGFTTNPTLMRKAGVTEYESFARDILREVKDRPISFEVFSDEFAEMETQAMKLASWAENVYVK